MSVRESLFSELQTLCKDARIAFKKTRQELSEFIGDEELVDYCATKGPLPDYPDNVFDIMVLSNKLLHDYEMKQQGALHHVLPLRSIIGIEESFEEQEDKEFLSVTFKASSIGGGLVFQGELADTKKIRRFSSAVAKKIVEST